MSKANKTEVAHLFLWTGALAVSAVIGTLYYLQWQVYVLYVDYVLSLVSLIFIGVETALSVVLFFLFLW